MDKLLYGLKQETNTTFTTNGAVAYKSTLNKVYDLFATGAAMRYSTVNDCIMLFKKAYDENPTMALKCLFYLRDVRGGQGERRFFRVCMNWLAKYHQDDAMNLIQHVAEYGRWDDLYCFVNTPLEHEMFSFMKRQFTLDLGSKTPSLLAKWLKSENASSKETAQLAARTRAAFGITARQYRKALSFLRGRIKIVETLMSQNRWDEIEFDKIPSRAGLIYANAFARRDILQEKYKQFMQNEANSVNAGALYPYDVVHEATKLIYLGQMPENYFTRKLAVNKYWDNLTDYFNNATLNALVVCDTSGSMTWSNDSVAPIDIAISLALYAAERAQGPYHGHYISFSSRPELIETYGTDFCDKVEYIYKANLCENTNIEATFDLILRTALKNHLRQSELPESIVIISDMQFDCAVDDDFNSSVMEQIRRKWEEQGYKMPKLVFWNVNASLSKGNLPMRDEDGITFVSGASPVTFEMIMSGKSGIDVMYDKLNSSRYEAIKSVHQG